MMIYLQLFFEFFKAGLFAIGGGMATLPFLYDISDKTGWFTYGQLADMWPSPSPPPAPSASIWLPMWALPQLVSLVL